MPSYIDIFAGCGGLSTGLYNSGFWHGLFAIEKSPDAFKTLYHNLIQNKKHFSWPEWLQIKEHDINDVLSNYKSNLMELRGKVDLVVGGPPCQGFSIAGRRNESDERNSLINSYLKFISYVQPQMVLFENVKGFGVGFKRKDNTRSKAYSQIVLEELQKLGYKYIDFRIVDFSEFGVPQKRERYIIVASKKEDVNFFQELYKTKNDYIHKKGLSETVTLLEALSDLSSRNGLYDSPDSKGFKTSRYGEPVSNYQKLLRRDVVNNIPDSHRFAKHSSTVIDKFRTIIRHKMKPDEIRRTFSSKKNCLNLLNKMKPSPTITTLPDDYVHYEEPRILTVREYARIQSFPDWFEFKGKYTTGGDRRKIDVPRYSQIGNAIPPLFGEQCGIALRNIL